MKKKNILFIALSSIIILVLGIALYIYNSNNLKINISGINIDKNQYINVMNSKKYDVSQYFVEKYGANITNDFWQQEFSGEVPYKVLADETINELLRIHSIYNIAKEKGYVDSEEYKDFLARLNNENTIRQKNIKDGIPVFGLSEFTEELYLEYETDRIEKSYSNDLSNEGMDISLDESTKYYEENKELLFKKDDDYKLHFVKVYYGVLDLSEEEVKDIKNRMLDISKKINSDNSLLSLASNDEKLKEYTFDETILSSELSSKAKVIGDVLDIAMKLERGDITQVIDQNGCLYLIQCVDKVNYDYLPYEEVEDNINKVLREERYKEIVENNAKKLVINNDIQSTYKFTNKILNGR